MLKEVFEAIFKKGDDSKKPEVFPSLGEPAHIKRIMLADRSILPIEIEPGVRTLGCHRLDDIATQLRGRLASERMILAVSFGQVTLHYDTANGREFIQLILPFTKEMKFILARQGKPELSADEFRSALRYEFTETMSEERLSRLTKQVSNLRFAAEKEEARNMDRAGESMGASVQTKAEGTEGLPDERQRFMVRPWIVPDLDFRHPIECILDPDTAQMRWRLVPLEHSVIEFQKRCLDEIFDRLEPETSKLGAKLEIIAGKYLQDQPGDD